MPSRRNIVLVVAVAVVVPVAERVLTGTSHTPLVDVVDALVAFVITAATATVDVRRLIIGVVDVIVIAACCLLSLLMSTYHH